MIDKYYDDRGIATAALTEEIVTVSGKRFLYECEPPLRYWIQKRDDAPAVAPPGPLVGCA
jgi:hypothetical protein